MTLKDCPHCGAKATIMEFDAPLNSVAVVCSEQCTNTVPAEFKEEIIKRWNHRC